ncbi:MAG: anthranilate synthase component I family protein [Flavobacteriaceae bacterium]|nr:anthranilate synthase component I family protein [Flavobacteriaceae bacterium]
MKRKSKKIVLKHPEKFKSQLLNWAQQFDIFIWLDSNNYHQKYSSYDMVLAVGVHQNITCDCSNAFNKLKVFQKNINDYIFGYLGYDLKNDLEDLSSNHYDGIGFSDLYFFQPKKLFLLKKEILEVKYLSEFESEIEDDLKKIQNLPRRQADSKFKIQNFISQDKIKIKQRISKNNYSKKLTNILEHIHRGDIYEVNFCQEFYAKNSKINPLEVYQKLNKISSPPFATFLKIKDKYLLSASPERFVKKEGNKIISQPIKGTARRLPSKKEDVVIAKKLYHDPKERAENIMIVDLVRNDLSKTATKGSVKVEELCEVYSFKQVHQLISTVVSATKTDQNPVDIVKSLFPMGSMTGAPKISAMEIIEQQEETKRGLYSGAVGYFTPDNNFDFNVVIRSILHNSTKLYTSFIVGGAITSQSEIENEYEECMLKAKAMKKALKN